MKANTTTTATTYKYHYIGSQITTIEIDQTQTVDDGEGEPVTTTTKDDEIRIHLGANSRPISFEYYTENQGTQQTTSATYYYHYDLHGNVIRVTNSSGTTVIQYTYDQLGTIVSQTNSSNIYNPFTYMGEAQVIHDDEFDTSGSAPKTGLYNSGSGYYNPKTGTFLGGSGAPASANPSSTSAEEPTAQCTAPTSQTASSTGAATAPQSTSTSAPGSSEDIVPAMPIIGGSASSSQSANSDDRLACESEELIAARRLIKNMHHDPRYPPEWDSSFGADNSAYIDYFQKNRPSWRGSEQYKQLLLACLKTLADGGSLDVVVGGNKIAPMPGTPAGDAQALWDNWNSIPSDVRDKIVAGELGRNPGVAGYYGMLLAAMQYGSAQAFLDNWIIENVVAKLDWAVWGTEKGSSYLFGYQIKGEKPVSYWGLYTAYTDCKAAAGIEPGAKVDPGRKWSDEGGSHYIRPT